MQRPGHISCIQYDWIPDFETSDHKPVYALLEVRLKPGRDNLPLNAGSFNREIYIEALKRRADESDEAIAVRRGSLVCSIS